MLMTNVCRSELSKGSVRNMVRVRFVTVVKALWRVYMPADLDQKSSSSRKLVVLFLLVSSCCFVAGGTAFVVSSTVLSTGIKPFMWNLMRAATRSLKNLWRLDKSLEWRTLYRMQHLPFHSHPSLQLWQPVGWVARLEYCDLKGRKRFKTVQRSPCITSNPSECSIKCN